MSSADLSKDVLQAQRSSLQLLRGDMYKDDLIQARHRDLIPVVEGPTKRLLFRELQPILSTQGERLRTNT